MIMLFGGTSETGSVAHMLAEAGYEVFVSCATDVPLSVSEHRRITHRRGNLNLEDMLKLIRENGINGVVDVTHPYAVEVKQNALEACNRAAVPYFRLIRPSTFPEGELVHRAADHQAGAELAVSFKKPILLTVGTRNLEPYAAEARAAGCPLFARVLPIQESLRICRRAGLDEGCIIAARGPFSLEDNLKVIRKFDIGVLVTKDSGESGGVPAKLEAAGQENCAVIVIERPPPDSTRNCCTSTEELVERCRQEVER